VPAPETSRNIVRQFGRKPIRLLHQFYGLSDNKNRQRMADWIDSNAIDRVLAFWGTQVLGDIISLKRLRPRVQVFLNVLCHPTALSNAKVAAQNWYFRRSARHCDGLIASSEVMQRYLLKHVVSADGPAVSVCPPYLSKSYFPSKRAPTGDTGPNILFLGRLDWRSGQTTDNMLPTLEALMREGIHVHFHKSVDSISRNRQAHTFDYMPLREAIAFATQFDASLIMYNLSRCPRPDRFQATVPDRLIASVAAGIPIAVPESGYDACREYLGGYRSTIYFRSVGELAARLKSRDEMQAMKRMAIEDSVAYAGEGHLNTLLRAIHS
jgi:hypothetical protein